MKHKKKYIIFLILFSMHSLFASEGSVCIECHDEGPGMFKFFADMIKNKLCIEPKEGKPINVNDFNRKYRLTKVKEGHFLVEVNPLFFSIPDGKKNNFENEVSSYHDQKIYNEKMNECFANFKPYLKGPNGESLEIKIKNDRDVPRYPVTLQERGFRSSSRKFEYSIDCPVMLHETLHVLGLVDEYKEKSRGYVVDPQTGERINVEENAEIRAYDCRALGPENSVMNDQDLALLSVLPYRQVKAKSCVCKSKSLKTCVKQEKKYFAGKPKPNCPKHYFLVKKEFSEISKEVAMQFRPQSKEIASVDGKSKSNVFDGVAVTMSRGKPKDKIKGYEFEISREISSQEKKDKKSILMPAHFRFITNPNCHSENKEYIDCAKSAYVSTQETENKRCSEKAIQCQNNQDWLK